MAKLIVISLSFHSHCCDYGCADGRDHLGPYDCDRDGDHECGYESARRLIHCCDYGYADDRVRGHARGHDDGPPGHHYARDYESAQN